MGDLRLSEMLDEIRGTGVFKNLVEIISDNSRALSYEIRKEIFFFGSRYNLKILWEYCTLSKFDLDENPGILDEGDKMRLADYKELMDFYLKHKTMKTSDEDTIMELFNYFVNRDMILLASLMQSSDQPLNENTLLRLGDTEKQNEMETDVPSIVDLDFDIPSEAELFYRNWKVKEPKMYGLNLQLSKGDKQ